MVRVTVLLDEDLVRRTLRETGARSKTEFVEMGLRSLLERTARARLKALHGHGPRLSAVRRRRLRPRGPQKGPQKGLSLPRRQC